MMSNHDSKKPSKLRRSAPRILLYVLGLSFLVGANLYGLLLFGYFPLIETVGTAIILIAIFAPPYLYKRLRNGSGALRGLENGPKQQFAEYLKRQSPLTQQLYQWIVRLRIICLGILIGGLITFCGSVAYSQPLIPLIGGWLLAGFAYPGWLALGGVGALQLRGAIYPSELWVGKREFVIGRKAIFGGLSRITLGGIMLYTPLSLVYWIYLFATGKFAGVIAESLRRYP